MRHSRKIVYILFIFLPAGGFANDSLVMQLLLQRISQLQVLQDDVFPKGSFASYRMYALNKDREKADINGFFTGLIAFTLRDIKPQLTKSQQDLAQLIVSRTLPTYAKFQNRKGRPTYNFWPTDTPKIFPNAGWMNIFDKSQALPDDLDDTVIMLLAQDAGEEKAMQAHNIMQDFTNTGGKKVRNTFRDYRGIGAYSTWFGKKMPVDFDVCVLANVLYFVQSFNLAWTHADSASLELIVKVMDERKHETAAPYVSPHYSRLPNILYHLSRLMAVRPIPALEKRRVQLIEDARKALLEPHDFMDEVMLGTSLLRWDITPPAPSYYTSSSLQELVEGENFSFFIANMASMLPDPFKRWMGLAGVGKFYYYCPSYNNLLLLENLAWRKKKGLSSI